MKLLLNFILEVSPKNQVISIITWTWQNFVNYLMKSRLVTYFTFSQRSLLKLMKVLVYYLMNLRKSRYQKMTI